MARQLLRGFARFVGGRRFADGARVLLVAVFLFSGFVKAADPRGTAYKLVEYARFFGMDDWVNEYLTVAASIGLASLEFLIGILLLLGIRRELAGWAVTVMLAILTPFTLFVAIKDPVQDCGCFGDAITLSNWQTFWKNVVLLVLAIALFRHRKELRPLLSYSSGFVLAVYAMVLIVAFACYSCYYLPALDFRPYKVGTELQAKVFPEGDEEAELYDFYLSNTEGEDATADILFAEEPLFLLVSPYVEDADRGVIDDILGTLDFAHTREWGFYVVTASEPEKVRNWEVYMGEEIAVLRADATLLKTMVRSNPGLVLLDRGKIVNKWSCHNMPRLQDSSDETVETLSANKEKENVWARFIKLFLLSLIPIFLLTFVNPKLRKSMRKKIVAGNWKMNLNLQEGVELAKEINNLMKAEKPNCEVVICTPFIHLATVAPLLDKSLVKLGAENCADKASGAYTGEVSAAMVKSTGADYVILGHSERRSYYGENAITLKEKVDLALASGLDVIFCIGEVLGEREAGKQELVVAEQLEGSLYHLTAEQLSHIVLAYEPVWAIGTGKTATKEQAQEMHAFIRKTIANKFGSKAAEELTILYGGSCKPSNAKDLFSQPDVDGGLIGGASLKADSFKGIIDAWR